MFIACNENISFNRKQLQPIPLTAERVCLAQNYMRWHLWGTTLKVSHTVFQQMIPAAASKAA